MEPIRLALTKGRLEAQCRSVLAEAGYDCSALESPGRRLIHILPHREPNRPALKAVLAKAPDVVTYVARGVCDAGIAGKDTIMENGGSFYEMLDLNIGRCRFAIAAPKDSGFFEKAGHKRVATKYPGMTRRYLLERSIDAEIIRIEGSCELAPLIGLSDAIADIVETGDTLRENGLEVLCELFPISARLIVNVAAYKLRRSEIEALIGAMKGIVEHADGL